MSAVRYHESVVRHFLELAKTDDKRPWALRVGGGLPALVILGFVLQAVLLPVLCG